MATSDLQLASFVNMMMQLYSKRFDDEALDKQYNLQRSRYENMAGGGDGGKAGRSTTHQTSIRELHHAAWSDADFKELLDRLDFALKEWHQEHLGDAQRDIELAKQRVEKTADQVFALLSPLSHNDIVYILNDMAEQLGVTEPGDD